ncbi:MAG: flagellar basal-body MS-ring/collar protein FliF [Planctomycetota bacterium]|jgi:flagellar M-ring protein FliF
MNLMQKIALVWERVSLVQRALLIAILLTFVVVGGLLTQWARRPDMRTLYSDLAAEEASKITEKISEKDVPYELRNGGTTILVPKQHVYQLRIDLAQEGLPSGEQAGYKLFDNQRISQSPLVENVNLKRALQEELAKSIQMIDGISHARVHIVSSEQSLFAKAGRTTASVVVRLKPGHNLTGTNVAAITHLVSGSVESLDSEGVSVINSQGQLLTGESDNTLASGASTVQDYRERVESNLAHKAEQMLTTVLGQGRAIVKVSAVIDMNSINIVKKVFEPKGVKIKEEIQESSKPVSGGDENQAVGKETEGTINTEYSLGETVETRVELPGKIMSLSVAAFVDLTPPDVNMADSGAEITPIMAKAEVEEAIRNAIGLKSTDALTVVDKRFYRSNEPVLEEESSNWPRYIAIARQSSLGIMAICALIVLKIFSGAKTKVSSASPLPTTHQLAGSGTAGLLPAGSGGDNMDNSMALRGHISDALQNNPEQVKQLFASWLEETEE